MGDIVRLVPKSELERIRLIREARAIYDSIFPPAALVCKARAEVAAYEDAGALDRAGKPGKLGMSGMDASAYKRQLLPD
jgi:hypothetical protein